MCCNAQAQLGPSQDEAWRYHRKGFQEEEEGQKILSWRQGVLSLIHVRQEFANTHEEEIGSGDVDSGEDS